MTKLKTDICVIGAGSAGLLFAAGAAQMGAKIVLIEESKMGGDCLNYGCVPSKALIACAGKAYQMKIAEQFGLQAAVPEINFKKVMAYVHQIQAAIAPNDSVERYEGFGVRVIHGAAKFIKPNIVTVGDEQIQAKYFVIASGARAAVPPISGLAETPYLTNETIFSLEEKPEHLLVIGGGPIGVELAQAYARLGVKVSMLIVGKLLPHDDAACVAVIREQLIKDGMILYEAINGVTQVAYHDQQFQINFIDHDDHHQTISSSHCLVATGRQPNLSALNLEAAGVAYEKHGIKVDARQRTANKKIYAIGDCVGPFQFTHIAAYQAGIALRNILFKWPAKVDYRAVPWVTYTSPELAHVGASLSSDDIAQHGYQVLTLPFSDNDRAQTESATNGFIKITLDKKGIVVACDVVGLHAGELILPWSLLIQNKMHISKMATVIAAYPTLSEISKRVAGQYYAPKLFAARTQKIVRFLMHWFS